MPRLDADVWETTYLHVLRGELRNAYRARPDGTTTLPFRRIFAVGQRR